MAVQISPSILNSDFARLADGVFPAVGAKRAPDVAFTNLYQDVLRPIGGATAQKRHYGTSLHGLRYRQATSIQQGRRQIQQADQLPHLAPGFEAGTT